MSSVHLATCELRRRQLLHVDDAVVVLIKGVIERILLAHRLRLLSQHIHIVEKPLEAHRAERLDCRDRSYVSASEVAERGTKDHLELGEWYEAVDLATPFPNPPEVWRDEQVHPDRHQQRWLRCAHACSQLGVLASLRRGGRCIDIFGHSVRLWKLCGLRRQVRRHIRQQ